QKGVAEAVGQGGDHPPSERFAVFKIDHKEEGSNSQAIPPHKCAKEGVYEDENDHGPHKGDYYPQKPAEIRFTIHVVVGPADDRPRNEPKEGVEPQGPRVHSDP
ncbi:MAG: hypothetical protein AAFO91_02840, partial [Bacteroidota bacterium]